MGEPKFYSSYNLNINYINLIDTRGFEKNKGYLIQDMEKEIINFINKQKLTNQPIHLVWYCFKGSRFEDIEELLIQKIKKLNVPVLLVYTQAVNEELIDFNVLSNKGYDCIEIIAQDIKGVRGKIINSFGLDDLIEKTNEYINENYFKTLKDIIIKQLNNLAEKKSNNLENLYKNNLNKENFIFKLINSIKSFFQINNNDNNDLLNNLNEFKIEFKKISEEYVLHFINENNYDLIGKLLNLQQNINIEKNGILTNLKNREQWSKIIESKIKNEMFQECFNDIISNIHSIIFNIYIEYLYSDDYKKYLNKIIIINNNIIEFLKNKNL
jgi:hypothetical protein